MVEERKTKTEELFLPISRGKGDITYATKDGDIYFHSTRGERGNRGFNDGIKLVTNHGNQRRVGEVV